jgi:DNA primase
LISKDSIEQIIETARVEEVVADFVALKKRGVNYIGLCPFHNEKTPSFTVSPAKGIYKCFGCGAAGNSVNFVMEHEKMSYPDALRYLAQKYNITIEETALDNEQIAKQNEKESLYILAAFAQKHFTKNLHYTDEGRSVGLSYFKERGFNLPTIEKFQLGYAPDDYQNLTQTANEQGYALNLLEKTGLVKQKDERYFDFFRARVIFPVHNLTGKVVGFGARTLKNDKKEPKYLNSPETEIYNKSNILYGIYFAKKAIVANDNCFLVEGYTDVISLHQAGIENVVASSGTSLTSGQIRLIKRYTPNITILYDGDAAGIKASFRGIDMILEEGMNVKIVLFPDGDDPDSYARKVSSQELENFIHQQAKDFLLFKTGLLYEEAKNDPVKKSALIKEIVTSIALIPDAIMRSVYIKECSRLFDINEQTLIFELNKLRRQKIKNQPGNEALPETTQTHLTNEVQKTEEKILDELLPQEQNLVRLLLNYADKQLEFEIENEAKQKELLITTVAEYILFELQQDGLELKTPELKAIVDEYMLALENNLILTDKYFLQKTENGLNKTAIDMISLPYTISPKWNEKYRIRTKTESDKISLTVRNAIYSYKLKHILQLTYKLQEKLKLNLSEQEIDELLRQQLLLNEVKKIISEELGRIIVK